MHKTAKPKAKTPKEQYATFLSEVEKLRADGTLTSTESEALGDLENLLQKKALTDRPEPSLDSESRNEDN
jgi:hypothetical protein